MEGKKDKKTYLAQEEKNLAHLRLLHTYLVAKSLCDSGWRG